MVEHVRHREAGLKALPGSNQSLVPRTWAAATTAALAPFHALPPEATCSAAEAAVYTQVYLFASPPPARKDFVSCWKAPAHDNAGSFPSSEDEAISHRTPKFQLFSLGSAHQHQKPTPGRLC